MNKSAINFILYIILAFLWSASYIGIKLVVLDFPPAFSALLRIVVACLAIVLYCLLAKKKMSMPIAIASRFWISGLFSLGIPFLFLFWGECYVEPAIGGILNATTPLWVFCISLFMFREKNIFVFSKVFGLILGFMGVVFIFLPSLDFNQQNIMTLKGIVAINIMAVAYAIGALLYQSYSKRYQGQFSFYGSVIHQYLASIVFLLLISLHSETWPAVSVFEHSYKDILALLYLGISSTALAFIIYYHLIHSWGAVRASTVVYLVPLLAIVWDDLFLHKIPHENVLLGAATILCGVLFIQWHDLRKIFLKKKQANLEQAVP
ncbi:MAG: DMT family transporter [Gammaproteobacteria bacterium]